MKIEFIFIDNLWGRYVLFYFIYGKFEVLRLSSLFMVIRLGYKWSRVINLEVLILEFNFLSNRGKSKELIK